MSDQFLLPELGEGLTEAEIVQWLVAEGDVVAIDQPVVEVESAKSVVELPSPYRGRVTALHALPGQSVQRGAPLLTISSDPTTGAGELVPGTALREDDESGSGAVLVGYGTREIVPRAPRPRNGRFGRRSPDSEASPSRPVAAPRALPTDTGPTAPLDPMRRAPVVSPIVRRLAREHGFDASAVAGSGRDGLVLRTDVEAAIAALEQAAPGRPLPRTTQETRQHLPDGGDTRIPITGMRKVIGARLARSRRVIPEATIWLDVDATELVRAKARLEQATGERFGVTALLARFTVAALQRYPVLNASVDEERNEIVQHRAVHLGLAAQTSRGLMVPVIRDADRMTTRQLRDAVSGLVSRTDSGEYAADEASGSTFTLNNYGGFGVDGSAPIINHPEVAMLGVGRIIDRPWVVDGQLAVRKVVLLSFAFDHRVCDGDVASGFLTTVARSIEEPLLLLADS